jgi:hypothetical protein
MEAGRRWNIFSERAVNPEFYVWQKYPPEKKAKNKQTNKQTKTKKTILGSRQTKRIFKQQTFQRKAKFSSSS